MKMHDPPHPEEIIKELCLEPLSLSVTDAAKALGVSRKTLSSIVNGRAGISPEMAMRLSMASTPLLRAGSTSKCSTTYGSLSESARNSGYKSFRRPELGIQ